MATHALTLPYPGMRAFGREESMLFFGRENCVDSMIERLAATRFLGVLGASGSGKSSLVRTGLLDGLELGFFARAGARWRIVETHPGGAPMRNLAEALALAGDEADGAADIEALLTQGRRSLIEWASGGRLAPGENLLVLVDQFEELFRYADYAAREEAEDFVALLTESARAAEVPIHVVTTMRSEYLGACALIPGLAEQINGGFYLTPRMSREECRQAIEGPAAVMGFDIEPALTNRILNDMAGFAPWEVERGVVQGQILSRRADQLPLMQHLLNRLWLHARAAGPQDARLGLTVKDYEALGGLAGALDAHGAEVLASLDEADRGQVHSVFRALISGPDPTNAVRRPCRFGDIEAELDAPKGTAARIVNPFRAPGCNFLQPGYPAPLTADTLIDISHESLIRQWGALSEWMQDEARAGANWHRLLAAADRYASGEGDLLTGIDLVTLRQWWSSEHPSEIWAVRHGGRHAEAKAFLEHSAETKDTADNVERKRRSGERTRLFALLALAFILLPSLVLLGVALRKSSVIYGKLRVEEAKTAASEAQNTQYMRKNRMLQIAGQQIEKLAALKSAELLKKADQKRTVAENEAKDADKRARMSMSIVTGNRNITSAIVYCEEHVNEGACKILLDNRNSSSN